MRRILVPLDGSDLAASILEDAIRFAGQDGEIVLIRDAALDPRVISVDGKAQRAAVESCRAYLEDVAARLVSRDIRVSTQTLAVGDPAVAIDRAASILEADAIAMATHGRSPAERWWAGSVAWRATLRSPVPVLLRHGTWREPTPSKRRILVPLDGSALAEIAIPLAASLALEWNAELHLARVPTSPSDVDAQLAGAGEEYEEARSYIEDVTRSAGPNVHGRVLLGPVVTSLEADVARSGISDVVMTTHGRTGLSRAIVGSIADDFVHRLSVPIIIIPPLLTLATRRDSTNATASEARVEVQS